MSNADLAARDGAHRERALDTAGSFIVQAPAGSGKTELLTQRVLALLGEVDAPEQIVAMTFTRAAAAEMRRRIQGELASDRRPEDCSAEHERRTRSLAMAARARNAECGWQLEAASSRLRILTIDGFCGLLVRRAPWLSAAGGMPELLDDARPLYTEAARRAIAHRDAEGPLGEALRHALDRLDGDANRLATMLAELLGRRDAWRGMLSADTGAMRTALESALAALCDEALQRARATLGEAQWAAWWESVRAAARALANDEALQAAVRLGHLPCEAAECGHWPRLCALLLKQDGGIRQKVTKNDGFPTTDREALEAHKALLQSLQATPGAEAAIGALAGLVAPHYDDTQWRALADLLAVFRQALGELTLCFAEQGAVDHTEIALRALDALGDPEQPSALLLRMDNRIRHLLIDEFQDTSDLQMRLLERLTAGWAPGDGRSLFLVGDPMQSIYRFRSANVGLFLQARDQGVGDLPLEALRLSRNFRSQAGIVDWVNDAFPHILGADDFQRGAVAYETASPTHAAQPGAAVQWHLCDEAEEARRIAELAQQVAEDETLAVLVRGRSHLRAILPALAAAGVRPQAVDIEPLSEKPVVEDLLAITRAINDPADRIAWLAVLRGPCCGLPLPALQTLCAAAGAGEPLWPLLDDEAVRAQLDTPARDRLERVLPALRAAMRQRGRQPLAVRVERCWRALGGPACLAEDTALDHAHAMLEALATASDGGPDIDAQTLRHALDGLYASPGGDSDPRVQIMTMHKAKGLQFDHVVLPGLHRKPPPRQRPAVVQSSVLVDEHEHPLLAPLPRRDDDKDPLFRLLHGQLEGARDAAEADRLLYVAATRAVQRLHLFADVERKSDGGIKTGSGLLAHLWPAVGGDVARALDEAEAEAPATGSPPPTQADRGPQELIRLPQDWGPPPEPAGLPAASAPAVKLESLPPFDWAGERARVLGTLYHQLVECIARDGPERWDGALPGQRAWLLAQARAAGMGDDEAAAVAERVLEAAAITLTDADGRWLLRAHPGGADCELAMDTMVDGVFRRLRIDRSFVDAEGTRWIVDYKTGSHEGGDLDAFVDSEIARYRGQLEAYAQLFADEGRAVRLALYLPLLPQGRRLHIIG
ncbi:UvrD-helicase domain-containing protein [Algiphilus aromaticivorans]|uniref:UvrD-helicase domain-containing protein n=1 Tax=Algiphilus aromaticivorans TaxID=382454 RepID=UPI0005C1B466|nr:UvrD-helicase domain-containing protein [Algiphilus aromaticivorans]